MGRESPLLSHTLASAKFFGIFLHRLFSLMLQSKTWMSSDGVSMPLMLLSNPHWGAWSRCKALSETFFPCYWGSMNLWWGLMLFNLLLFPHTWEGFTMLPFSRSNRKAKAAGSSSGSKPTCEEMYVSCSFLSVSALLSSKKVNKSRLNALVVPLCISKQHPILGPDNTFWS